MTAAQLVFDDADVVSGAGDKLLPDGGVPGQIAGETGREAGQELGQAGHRLDLRDPVTQVVGLVPDERARFRASQRDDFLSVEIPVGGRIVRRLQQEAPVHLAPFEREDETVGKNHFPDLDALEAVEDFLRNPSVSALDLEPLVRLRQAEGLVRPDLIGGRGSGLGGFDLLHVYRGRTAILQVDGIRRRIDVLLRPKGHGYGQAGRQQE